MALRQFASESVREVAVWPTVERFRAPSSTHPPYRSLARHEARSITSDRAAAAVAKTEESVQSWHGFAWQTTVEVLVDVSSEALAQRLTQLGIDLLVVAEGERSTASAVRASERAACPALLVPSARDHLANAAPGDGQRRPRSFRLIPTLHR
jgi:hypothetical protein